MRKSKAAVALLFLLAPVSVLAQEKQPDIENHTVSPAAASVPGTLVPGPTFDRQFDYTNTGPCSSTSTNSGTGVGVYYTVFDIVSPGGTLADISITLGTLGDSVIQLYCTPFNPASPMTNLVFGDDDDGAGFASAITPVDNIDMVAGQVYQLVVTTFATGDQGTFTLELGSDIVIAAPVPTTNEWGLIVLATLLALGGATMIWRQQRA